MISNVNSNLTWKNLNHSLEFITQNLLLLIKKIELIMSSQAKINGNMSKLSEKILQTSKNKTIAIKSLSCGLLTRNASVKLLKVKMIHGKILKLQLKTVMLMSLPVQFMQLLLFLKDAVSSMVLLKTLLYLVFFNLPEIVDSTLSEMISKPDKLNSKPRLLISL